MPLRTDDVPWSQLGAGALRDHSISDVQKAIGKALSELTGTELTVTVTSLDLGSSMLDSATMGLAIEHDRAESE